MAVSQRRVSVSKGCQNTEECKENALGSRATSCVLETITEQFRVVTEIGNNENADHLGATDSLEPNNGSVVGTERLGRIEEALQARPYKAGLEHVG